MPEQAWQILSDAGVAGVAVTAISFLFLKLMKMHREERAEWRDAANATFKELTHVIRDINRDK